MITTRFFLKIAPLVMVSWLVSTSVLAQSAIRTASAKCFDNQGNTLKPDDCTNGERLEVTVWFNTTGTSTTRGLQLRNLDSNKDVPLDKFNTSNPAVLVVSTKKLNLTTDPKDELFDLKNKHYQLSIELVNNKTTLADWKFSLLTPLNEEEAVSALEPKKAKNTDDADIYVSGEVNGAKKNKTTFTTEISLQLRYKKIAKNTFITPFFKLNASTDADADPDKMEFGLNLRRRFNGSKSFTPTFFDTAVKIESERDFENTNLISDSRLTFLPVARPKGADHKLKVFFRPFIGFEVGKNLRSPLATAEGGAIARPLAGAKLRFNYPLNDDEEREVNWETTYTRRWLLKNELGFETNDDDELVLTKFGKSPRDHVESKFSYGVSKFFDFFIAYEWGQVPPSYKLINHRFKLGFAFKKKYAVKQ